MRSSRPGSGAGKEHDEAAGKLFAAALLVWLAVVPPAAARDLPTVDCGESSEGVETCHDVAPLHRLRWRGRAYAHAKQGKRPIYGGDHVVSAFADNGFEGPVEDDDWDVLFTHFPMNRALASVRLPRRRGRVVHNCGYFRGAGQKCILAQHLNRVRAAAERDGRMFRGFPRTFDLRRQYQHWIQKVEKSPEVYWLVKDCASGDSKGIELVKGSEVLARDASWRDADAVAQQYIIAPYLLAGRKFHLRHYVLVTSWAPVSAFLFDDGLLFHSRHAYDAAQPSRKRDVFSSVSPDTEVKRHSDLWRALGFEKAGQVRSRIARLFSQVLGSAIEESFGDFGAFAEEARGYGCFDLYGADVILDSSLEPLLLEINIGPNLWILPDPNYPEPGYLQLQRIIKEPLVRQLAHWLAQRGAQNASAEAALENFTRVL